MDLHCLSHVVALADTLRFAHVAQAVYLSQPASSRSVQAIEDDLGIRLFDCETDDVHPTPTDGFVIECARRLPFEAHYLQRGVGLYHDSQPGDTTLGIGPLLTATFMPQALQNLWQQHLRVALCMEVGN